MKGKFSKSKQITTAVISAIALATSLAYSNTAFAEENAKAEIATYFFDEVVVTATRTPVNEFKANANINVITSEDIAKNHYTDLSEALRSIPGVTIANYSLAGYDNSNGLKINGADEIVVLIDGVKMNVAGNKFSATMFKNLDNVERIEVLKGSASTLYGSDAKGGVINILTKKVKQNQSKIKITGGSYDTENYLLSTEGRDDDWSWRISRQKDILGDFKDGRGVTTPAYLNGDTTSIKLTKEFGEKSDLTFTYDGYQADEAYTALWEKDLKKGTIDNYDWKLIYNTKLDDKSTNQFSYMNSAFDTDYNKYFTNIKTYRISDQYTRQCSENNTLIAGFEFTQDKVVTFNNVKLTNRALYLQDTWGMDDRWTLTSGVRYDNNSGFGSHTSPSLNLGYTADDATNVYVGYSEYFIPPSPTNLYSAKYGNPNIKPETGNTVEFGINHRFDDTFVASAHVFQRDSTDRIGYISKLGKYTNVGDEKADGWDVQFKKQFSDALSGFVGYTHTNVDATAQRAENIDGYIPKGAWNIGLDYGTGKLDISLLGRGAIDRPGPQTSDAVDRFFPATTYWVWDIGFNYQATEDIKAFIKVNNIFDKFYAEHSNARYNWSTTPDEQWWSAPGRNVFVGMEYTF